MRTTKTKGLLRSIYDSTVGLLIGIFVIGFILGLLLGLVAKSGKEKFTQNELITTYGSSFYRDKIGQLSPGYHDFTDIGGNDKIKSLKIPKGMKITIFADAHFKGGSRTFASDVPNLHVYGFDRTTSSVFVDYL